MTITINMESLETAIEEFNNTCLANCNTSLLYHETDGAFEVIAYKPPCTIVLPDGVVTVYSKDQFSPDKQIGKKRREYIIDFVKALDEGWEAWQVEYQLSDRFV